MDIGHWTMAFFNYWYFFTAGSIAGLGTFGEAPSTGQPACLLASLLAPWQLIELIASAVNFPSCWPHTFIAPQKVPLTACNTCPLKSAPPIHNFYLNSQSQDKCYSIEKPRMTNRKVLRGKQGDHISLPSDRKVVRQIWQIAPTYLWPETLECSHE